MEDEVLAGGETLITVESWKTMPISRRTAAGSLAMSCPPMVALPPLGVRSVQSMEIVVVLPAPLGPRKPKISASPTSKEMPSTAVISPKRRESSETCTDGGTEPSWGANPLARKAAKREEPS